MIDSLSISCEIAIRWIPQDLNLWEMNIGLIIGLVSWLNEPIHKPMVTQTYVAIYLHYTAAN